MVPLMTSLFETIESLFELPNPAFFARYLKTLGLPHVHSLIESTIQESTGNIHMTYVVRKFGTQGKKDMQRGRFDNRGQCFFKVNRFTLVVPSHSEVSLVPLNGTRGTPFAAKDNFVTE